MLYAVTGIVLARELSQEDFGMVGAVLVFQAFASLLVDSGFSYALLQRKRPTRIDYSTVMWFNLIVAAVLYAILYLLAPVIADIFQDDSRIVPLSRVIFLSLILNASTIVQVNRLMKAMDVRFVALSNSIGLIVGGLVGIALAVGGCGAWAIVWQTISSAAVKSLVLWSVSRWRPLLKMSFKSLKSYFATGMRMMLTSFCNTVFLNIYSLVIGNRAGLVSLGYYTQSDKWSKMGITSITQVLTSSFIPPLSAVQDDAERYRALVSKMNKFTSYIVFPALLGLMLMATPIFHTLFGTKWDASIFLFQLLLLRGVFTVFSSLYSNYLLALGYSGAILRLEIFRDILSVAVLIATLPFITLETAGNPVYGLEIMVWGQLAAAVVTTAVSLIVVSRKAGIGILNFFKDSVPYLAQTLLIIPVMYAASMYVGSELLRLAVELAVGAGLYLGGNWFFGSKVQRDVIAYFRGQPLT